MMKIVHTSDWHLGQNFKNRTREQEHKEFFLWLENLIIEEKIDMLIVSGDIFDTTNPPKYALTLYHDFLIKITQTVCSDIVIVGGNHDSIATLEMTQKFAKFLNIHIVASGENMDEVIIPITKDGKLEAIVCGVPFLRDRVLKIENEFKDAMRLYYKKVYEKALAISLDVPIIATGHFTTTGASLNPDSEREIYIGKLVSVDSEILTPFDYVAMGHLHREQQVGVDEFIRYSGSPIALSFSEHNQQKKVIVVTFEGKKRTDIELVNIPSFKKLYRISGNLLEIRSKIKRYKNIENRPFIEVIVDDESFLNIDTGEFLQESYDLGVDILSLKKRYKIEDKVLIDEDTKLKQLDPLNVFEKRLIMEENIVNNSELKEQLITQYQLILEEIYSEDN